MYFSKKLIGNSRLAKLQYDEVQAVRNMNAVQEQMWINQGQLVTNDGLIPQDLYQEFDNVTVQEMRLDEGDTFLNDLLPNSKSVNIGTLVTKFRQGSSAGNAQTSMGGQNGILMDQVEYTYDGTIVPIHDTGFGRQWREVAAHTAAGFDALVDDQRESVRTIRNRAADTFMDGHTNKDGVIITVDGLSWSGMRADSRVAQVSLSFDFTDVTKTGDEIKAAFIAEIRDVMRITNKCLQDLTYYTSPQVISNMERKFSTQYDTKIIMQELADLIGVGAIKETSKLTGNQIMGFPLGGTNVRPVVGMGVNTVAMARPNFNSNHNFATWAAIGWEVREDFAGNTCAVYAA